MSLHSKAIEPVPEETARIARAAFPKGNGYLRLRDEIGSLYTDEAFAACSAAAPNTGCWMCCSSASTITSC